MFFSSPSKYTEISEKMKTFARNYSTPAEMCRAVFEYMEYTPNVTDINTTASVAFSMRKGVCQDYAHILISLLRYSGFNAIYVKGFTDEKTEQGVSHAWVETEENGKWIAYDATHPNSDASKYIKVGIGRDFGDCPMERGVFLGGGLQSQKIELKITD
jgi:transglutaminase-like putative cysteine protease